MESEALIAVLFLTQTSGGSSIMFRYPPHPRQPLRVSRPIYERATPEGAMATERRQRLGGYKDRARPYLGAETSLSQASHWRDTRGGHRSATSPESDDTEQDDVEEARWTPLHTLPGDMQDGRATRERKPRPATVTQERVKTRVGNERVKSWTADTHRPAQASPTTGPNASDGTGSSSSGGSSGDVREFDHCLGYELALLNALLSPQRALCHKRFQLVVDDLVFLGHPVCADEDGKWKFPDEGGGDSDSGEPERGRRARADGPVQAASKPHGNMEVISEGVAVETPTLASSISSLPKSSGTATPPASAPAHLPSNTSNPDSPPLAPLTAFHMVMVLDKPDRSAADPTEMDLDSMYDALYSEAVFKWTAAAWAEQARDSWVSKEARKIGSIREDAIAKLASLKQAQAELFTVSSLAMSLRVLYEGITNNVPSHIYVGSLPLDIRLPPRLPPVIEEWTRWGEDVSDDSDDSEAEGGGMLYSDEEDAADLHLQQQNRRRPVNLKPWKTLIALSNKTDEGGSVNLLSAKSLNAIGPFAMTAADDLTGSVEAERDYRELTEPVQRLLEVLDPMKPLVTIAALLDLDLENELYPLARYLIYTERVKLIDVVRPSLRNVFMPDTISNKSLPSIMAAWAAEFPYLPTFDRFISRISASPEPYRKLLPDTLMDNDREEYTRALYWALSNDLLIQVHEYVRVVAGSEVKAKAKQQGLEEAQAKRRRRQEEAEARRILAQNDSSPEEASHRPPATILFPLDTTTSATTDADNQRLIPETLSPDDDAGAQKDGLGFLRDPQPAIIDKPGTASPAESRCLRIIMESQDEAWQKRFAMCMRYFDGKHSLEEIQYQTDLSRKIVRQILTIFHADLIVFQHP